MNNKLYSLFVFFFAIFLAINFMPKETFSKAKNPVQDSDVIVVANFKTSTPAEGMLSEFFFFKNDRAYAVVTENDYKFVKRYNFEIQEYKDKK